MLLTDGEQRSTLAAARSLVRAGCEVHVSGHARWTLAGVSSGVRPARVRAHPGGNDRRWFDEHLQLIERYRIQVALPMSDAAVEALLTHRAELPATCALPFPETDRWLEATDKAGLLARSAAAGLDVPRSLTLDRVEASGAARQLRYPAVVKPHRSTVPGSAHALPVTLVEDAEACTAAIMALPDEAFPVLLQERIVGPGEGVFLLRWSGGIVAAFAHRRLRERPPSGGISVYRESIALEPDFYDGAIRLLEDLGWEGVAMIEGKRDLRTGRPVVMEINGRFWGSLQLAIDAGVDFPALLVAAAVGAPLPPSLPFYREGVRSRWEWGDLDHLLLRLLRSRRRLRLDRSAPSRLGLLRSFFSWDREHDRAEIWRRADPLPFILESLQRLLP